MDIHWIEAWTQNRVMEQNLMEDSFERLGFFSLVLRVLDLAFGPDGAFGMDIHALEAWTPNRVMEQNLLEDSF